MFEHWTQFAAEYAPHIGLESGVALRAHAMICTTLGSDWIEEQEQRIGLPGRTIADGHPLYRAMRGRTEFCVVEVCELASYLLALRNDSGLKDVIVALRDANKYESAVQELAFAWKFKIAGAAVRLGPKTATGVADVGATIGGREHIVEVSGFPSDPFKSDLIAFASAAQNALKSAQRRTPAGAAIAVELVVESLGKHADLRKLRAPVHAAIAEVVLESTRNGLSAQRLFGFGLVRVRPAGPHEIPDLKQWTMATCLTIVERGELNLVGTGIDYRRGKDTDWVYIRVPDEVRDPYAKIRGKLKIESRQLRGSTDGVIVIVAHGLHAGPFSATDKKLRAVVEEFGRHHESTTAIAIVTMPHKLDGTAGLAGAYFELGPDALPTSFWERMIAADQERSVLRELDVL